MGRVLGFFVGFLLCVCLWNNVLISIFCLQKDKESREWGGRNNTWSAPERGGRGHSQQDWVRSLFPYICWFSKRQRGLGGLQGQAPNGFRSPRNLWGAELPASDRGLPFSPCDCLFTSPATSGLLSLRTALCLTRSAGRLLWYDFAVTS